MWRRAWPRPSSSVEETLNSSTSSVAAIANTPSLKVSRREVPGSIAPDRRGRGGRLRERRRELAADQPDRLEVGVEEMLEHHAVAAGALVGAETLGGLLDGADDGEGLDS